MYFLCFCLFCMQNINIKTNQSAFKTNRKKYITNTQIKDKSTSINLRQTSPKVYLRKNTLFYLKAVAILFICLDKVIFWNKGCAKIIYLAIKHLWCACSWYATGSVGNVVRQNLFLHQDLKTVDGNLGCSLKLKVNGVKKNTFRHEVFAVTVQWIMFNAHTLWITNHTQQTLNQ